MIFNAYSIPKGHSYQGARQTDGWTDRQRQREKETDRGRDKIDKIILYYTGIKI